MADIAAQSLDAPAEAGEAEEEPILTNEIMAMSAEALRQRIQMIQGEIRIMQNEQTRLTHEVNQMKEKTKDNQEKIAMSRQLPHLVSTIAELLKPEDLADGDDEDDGDAKMTDDSSAVAAVIKTTTRQTVFLPVIGLVPVEELKPTDLVGVNKDSFLVLDKLPPEYDSRVKAMEIDERPTDDYGSIGGLDKEIMELKEAIVLPMTHKDRFDNIGIKPPKGCLLHGPPGTGKTCLARATAASTNATFLKLAGPQLVQMYIGDGAKIVRDAFALAKEKSPAIIFIDELDAIGMKRSGGGEHTGVREVQRTMLELLNQLDGFGSDSRIKVIAATNRPDVLDPALMRSGRLDRKIELPHPNEDARKHILIIHSRNMNYNKEEVNFLELARSTDDFNGAQLKAVCVEAGMEALRRGATELSHEDYVQGIATVQSKKKTTLQYYA